MSFKEFLTDSNKLDESTNIVPGDKVNADKLVKGKYYFAFYKNAGHTNMELFKFTGVSDAEQKYGDSGPVFDDLKSAKQKYNLKSTKEIANMDSKSQGREYGQSIRICGEWEGGDSGCYYYASGASWSRGSGADRLTFYTAVAPTNE